MSEELKTPMGKTIKSLNGGDWFYSDQYGGSTVWMDVAVDLRYFALSLAARLAQAEKDRDEARERVRELNNLIGKPPEGSHPDEWKPRSETWHLEQLNWIKEIERYRNNLHDSPPAEPPKPEVVHAHYEKGVAMCGEGGIDAAMTIFGTVSCPACLVKMKEVQPQENDHLYQCECGYAYDSRRHERCIKCKKYRVSPPQSNYSATLNSSPQTKPVGLKQGDLVRTLCGGVVMKLKGRPFPFMPEWEAHSFYQPDKPILVDPSRSEVFRDGRWLSVADGSEVKP